MFERWRKLVGAALVSITAAMTVFTVSVVSQTQLSGSVKIDGSSTVYLLTEAVAEEFQKRFPRVKVTVGISGTGGGFKKFARGETDISNASRPIKPTEDEECRKNGITYIELPVAYDALAVVVNPANNWCNYLTVEEPQANVGARCSRQNHQLVTNPQRFPRPTLETFRSWN